MSWDLVTKGQETGQEVTDGFPQSNPYVTPLLYPSCFASLVNGGTTYTLYVQDIDPTFECLLQDTPPAGTASNLTLTSAGVALLIRPIAAAAPILTLAAGYLVGSNNALYQFTNADLSTLANYIGVTPAVCRVAWQVTFPSGKVTNFPWLVQDPTWNIIPGTFLVSNAL